MNESPAAIVDRVSEAVIAALPYRVGTACSEVEREAVFQLRYETVVEMGWARREELPSGLERNDDDDDAIHVCAWDGEELIATARTVVPREGRRLPLEREFGVTAEPHDVEVGRAAIVPRLRGATGHGLVIALCAQCWLEMRALGLTDLVSAVPPRLVEVYRSIGFTVIELAPGREHCGEVRVPVRFDVIASAPELRRIWTAPRSGRREHARLSQ